ncbi:MAG TPA: hypothetical protein ENN53_03605 [Candidatus Acetothermia bacterium]|nr:hypothetical protein [Candidatus Acetothermia bacterium]
MAEVYSHRADGEVLLERGILRPLLTGEDVHRYSEPRWTWCCIYPYRLEDGRTVILEEREIRTRYPRAFKYLQRFRDELRETRVRQKTNPRYWYSCHRSRDMNVFETRRLITPEISHGPNMTICPAGIYHNTQVYSLLPRSSVSEPLEYWLGILNSRLLWWFISRTGVVLRGGFFRFKTNYLAPFPVVRRDNGKRGNAYKQGRLVAGVQSAQELRKRARTARTPHDKTSVERQILASDQQLDHLVYELYELTDEEIRIVEDVA